MVFGPGSGLLQLDRGHPDQQQRHQHLGTHRTVAAAHATAPTSGAATHQR